MRKRGVNKLEEIEKNCAERQVIQSGMEALEMVWVFILNLVKCPHDIHQPLVKNSSSGKRTLWCIGSTSGLITNGGRLS